MYPIKFENIYFEKIWGGRGLEKFRDNLPKGNVGESWDVAYHKNGLSVVANGKYKGMDLKILIDEKGQALLGTQISEEWFPLLIKLINAEEPLSIQVHPNDDYAKKIEGEMGKTEVWYIVEAFEGASIILGAKDCTREKFIQAIESKNFDKYVNNIPVKKGEVYLVKSGLIHAIGQGVIIAEIQQNSDTTYRVYDYDRGRELHIKKALDVVDFNLHGKKSNGIKIDYDGYSKTYYCLCKDFSLELYDINTRVTEKSDLERFYIFTCVEGRGVINHKDGYENISLGDSILIPATLGEYNVEGNLKLLKSYVPNIERVKKDITKTIIY